MANLISSSDGNITAATFSSIETGTNALRLTRSGSATTTTSYVYTLAFTCTNTDVMDGFILRCKRVNTTGTVSVALSDDNGVTATREVVVNASDLPVEESWVFFKFGSTLTADGGADYKIGVKGSSAGNARFYNNGTSWAHIIRLTATATPAAGDVMYIVGEITGAGSTTTRTITMDNTVSTDYGTGTAGAADNGIEIGNAGVLTFGTTAATNYTLKCSGTINVWGSGTLSIGTTGMPIPRNSTATLTLDCGANVDFGLIINAGGTFNSQGLSRTSGKNIYYCMLNTDEAIASTSLGVDTDTGWLDNDEIAVASTTRTAAQSENGTLNGNAGASSLTVDGFGGAGGGLAYAHSGTSPTQAEVVLLTRNIKIQGASSTLQGYVSFITTSITDIDWTEFKWMGSATAGKVGINISTNSSGSFNMQYSSIHDFSITGSIGMNIASSSLVTVSYNVFYNNKLNHLIIGTSSAHTFSYNYFIKTGTTSTGQGVIILFNNGLTFTYNTIVSSEDVGLYNTSSSSRTSAVISNINIHSCTSYGMQIYHPIAISFSNFTIWRNGASGIQLAVNSSNSGAADFELNSFLLFGNTTNNILTTGIVGPIYLNDCTLSGDSSFATTNGITTGSPCMAEFILNSCVLGYATGIYTAHTTDISLGSDTFIRIKMNNSKLSSGTEFNSLNFSSSEDTYIKSQKHDQTTGNHKTWKRYGTISIDTTANMYRTASPSERLTPNTASIKLTSGTKKVVVANGATLTPSVYVRESVVGDGTDYNGNRARLILMRNDAIGITSDTVLDTATASSEGAFEQLTATTAAATDDGVMEFYVDCDGTTGWLNVDDWTVS
jgi:hypothetical protein